MRYLLAFVVLLSSCSVNAQIAADTLPADAAIAPVQIQDVSVDSIAIALKSNSYLSTQPVQCFTNDAGNWVTLTQVKSNSVIVISSDQPMRVTLRQPTDKKRMAGLFITALFPAGQPVTVAVTNAIQPSDKATQSLPQPK